MAFGFAAIRFASLIASITRAVPATLICHMRIDVQYAGTLWIDHEGEVHDRNRLQLSNQLIELKGGVLASEVERHETINGMRFGGGRQVDAHHRIA